MKLDHEKGQIFANHSTLATEQASGWPEVAAMLGRRNTAARGGYRDDASLLSHSLAEEETVQVQAKVRKLNEQVRMLASQDFNEAKLGANRCKKKKPGKAGQWTVIRVGVMIAMAHLVGASAAASASQTGSGSGAAQASLDASPTNEPDLLQPPPEAAGRPAFTSGPGALPGSGEEGEEEAMARAVETDQRAERESKEIRRGRARQILMINGGGQTIVDPGRDNQKQRSDMIKDRPGDGWSALGELGRVARRRRDTKRPQPPSNSQLQLIQQQMTNPSEESQARALTSGGEREARAHEQHEMDFEKRLMEWKQKYEANRAISDKAYYILLVIYSLFIVLGTLSNSLICLTVILKPKILSPRNIFIVNLAGSDLLLCVFTMPFSFIEISMKMWQMGLIPCKLVAGLQATSIFVSTISITAIALDRYKVIVYPTHQETHGSTRRAALLLASVWFGALLLSSPLFQFRTVEHVSVKLPSAARHKYGTTLKAIDFCIEDWPLTHGRGIYSVISMMFQYVLPITIVSVVYAKISDKLKKRLIRRQRLTQLECQQKRQLNLIRRTHTMLISVSLIFGLSWLPLNLLNVLADFTDLFKGDDQLFRVVFAICHLIGCSSACTNPILYGYLNENFRKEFHQVYTHHMRRLVRLCSRRPTPAGSAYMAPNASSITTSSSSALANANLCENRKSCDSEFEFEDDEDEDEDDEDDEEDDEEQDPSEGSSQSQSQSRIEIERGTGSGCKSRACRPVGAEVANANANAMAEGEVEGEVGVEAEPDGRRPSKRSTSCQHLFPLLGPIDIEGRRKVHSALELSSEKWTARTDHNKGRLESTPRPGPKHRSATASPTQASEAGANMARPASCVLDLGGRAPEDGPRLRPDEEAAARRCSYQTTTSSGRLGLTMKFCLCLSGTSSSETLAGRPARKQSRRKHGKSEAPDKRPLNHNQRSNKRAEQLCLVDMTTASGGQTKQVVDKEEAAAAAAQGRGRSRRRRWRRKWARQAGPCECKCHGQVAILVNGGGGGGVGQVSGANEPSKLMMLKSCSPSASGGRNRLDDGEPERRDEAGVAAGTNSPQNQGRRVWLRFLPAGRVKHETAEAKPTSPLCSLRASPGRAGGALGPTDRESALGTAARVGCKGGGAAARGRAAGSAGRSGGQLCQHCVSNCRQSAAAAAAAGERRQSRKRLRPTTGDEPAERRAGAADESRGGRRRTLGKSAPAAVQGLELKPYSAAGLAVGNLDGANSDGEPGERGGKGPQVGTYYLSIETARWGRDGKRGSEISKEQSTSVFVLAANSDLDESITANNNNQEPHPVVDVEAANHIGQHHHHHHHHHNEAITGSIIGKQQATSCGMQMCLSNCSMVKQEGAKGEDEPVTSAATCPKWTSTSSSSTSSSSSSASASSASSSSSSSSASSSASSSIASSTTVSSRARRDLLVSLEATNEIEKESAEWRAKTMASIRPSQSALVPLNGSNEQEKVAKNLLNASRRSRSLMMQRARRQFRRHGRLAGMPPPPPTPLDKPTRLAAASTTFVADTTNERPPTKTTTTTPTTTKELLPSVTMKSGTMMTSFMGPNNSLPTGHELEGGQDACSYSLSQSLSKGQVHKCKLLSSSSSRDQWPNDYICSRSHLSADSSGSSISCTCSSFLASSSAPSPSSTASSSCQLNSASNLTNSHSLNNKSPTICSSLAALAGSILQLSTTTTTNSHQTTATTKTGKRRYGKRPKATCGPQSSCSVATRTSPSSLSEFGCSESGRTSPNISNHSSPLRSSASVTQIPC